MDIRSRAPTKTTSLYVVHEYGARRHFLALEEWACEQANHGVSVQTTYITLSLVKRVVKGLFGKSTEPWHAPLRDLVLLFNLSVSRGKTLVIGVAPASPWILIMLWLKMRHYVVYFTSWPFWESRTVPHPPRTKWIWELWKKFLREGQTVAAVSKAAANAVEALGARAVVVRHSVDTNVFQPAVHREVESTVAQVLFVGRLTESKGVRDILRVASCNTRATWVFVGTGPLESEIRNAEGNVRLAGYISKKEDLVKLYQGSDILLLPSRRSRGWEELFGIVIIEAMACGVVPVASDHVGPREIIDDSITGFIVPEGDFSALTLVIERLLADRPLRRRMARQARAIAEQYYDVRVLARHWGDALQGAWLAKGTGALVDPLNRNQNDS